MRDLPAECDVDRIVGAEKEVEDLGHIGGKGVGHVLHRIRPAASC
ncbi:hypothetical protein ACFQ1I_06505 [Kitasatospora arboriphila]